MNRGGAVVRGSDRQRGFTLIEMVVTVALVGILASAMLPLAELNAQRARENELRLALRQIRSAIDTYKLAYDEGRLTRTVDASGYPPSLAVLTDGVDDIRQPDKRTLWFLRRLPRDPMAADASVPAAETWGLRSYASPPDETREGADVFDVFSRSEGIGLNGVPYREW